MPASPVGRCSQPNGAVIPAQKGFPAATILHRGAKTWNRRFSALFQTLTHHVLDPQPASLPRKSLSSKFSAPLTSLAPLPQTSHTPPSIPKGSFDFARPPAPQDPPPIPPAPQQLPPQVPFNAPPPYSPATQGYYNEQSSYVELKRNSVDNFRPQPGPPPNFAQRPNHPKNALHLQTELQNTQIHKNNTTAPPEIAPPTPPSPVSRRSTLQKEQFPVSNGQRSVSAAITRDDGLNPSKLRHQDTLPTRPRAVSLQQNNMAFPQPGLKSYGTAPLSSHQIEPRGRTGGPVQQPVQPIPQPAASRSSTSISPSKQPAQEVSPNPTSRSSLRRSWLGGSRSRSNSVDVAVQNTSFAWILTDENRVEYNVSFLKNGDKASHPHGSQLKFRSTY